MSDDCTDNNFIYEKRIAAGIVSVLRQFFWQLSINYEYLNPHFLLNFDHQSYPAVETIDRSSTQPRPVVH